MKRSWEAGRLGRGRAGDRFIDQNNKIKAGRPPLPGIIFPASCCLAGLCRRYGCY